MTEPLVFRGPEGAITVTAGALTRLVVRATQSVEGARIGRPKRAVEVAHADGRASVSIRLAVEHGTPVPALARAVQERVAEAVASTSGLEVDSVDLSIEEFS